MQALWRVMLTVVSLIASASIAQARDDGFKTLSADVPLPVERPLSLDGFATSSDTVPASHPGRRPGRHRPLPDATPAEASAPTRDMRDTDKPAPMAEAASTPGNDPPQEAAAPTIGDLVTRHARDNGVPVGLAEAVIRIESRGNPLAAHGGALGLMQIKPDTARAAGFSGGASALLVADTNLRFGMKILGQAYRSSKGDVCRALMLYRSGHRATRMSAATRGYCGRALAIMAGT